MGTTVGLIDCLNGQISKIRLGDADWMSISAILYLPTNYDPSKKYPLIAFGHGLGERGTNLDILLNQGLPYVINEHIKANDIARTDLDKFIIFAIQSSWGSPVINDFKGAIDYLQTKLSIDENRIYFTGLSAGGGSASAAIPNYPDVFAAVVPMSTVNTNPFDGNKYANGYAWFFHSVNDSTCTFSWSKDYAIRINALYPDHAILYSDNQGHGGWIDHYEPSWKWINPGAGGQDIGTPNGLNIYQWLLQHSLNNPIPITHISIKKTIMNVVVNYSDGTQETIS